MSSPSGATATEREFLDGRVVIRAVMGKQTLADLSRNEQVEVKTLDTALAEVRAKRDISGSVFLKIDTQGFDLEVLKGGTRSLAEISAVQTELSCQNLYRGMPGYIEVLSALERYWSNYISYSR